MTHGRPFVAGVGTATPLLSEQDVADLAETIEPGSSAAVVAWKNPQPHRRSLLLRQQLPAVRQHHHQRCVHPRPANPTRRRHRVTRRRGSPRLGHRGRSPTPASSAASPVNSNDPRTATYPTQRLTPHRGLMEIFFGIITRQGHPPRHSHLGERPRHHHRNLHRRLERPPRTLRLDQDRRRHPQRSTAPSNNFQHATLGPRSLPGIGRHPGRPLAVSLLVPAGVGGHGRRQRGKDPVRADALQQADPP